MPGYAHDTWPQHENDSHTIQGIPTYYVPLKSSIQLQAILSSDSFINKLFSYPRLILFVGTPSYTLPASGLLLCLEAEGGGGRASHHLSILKTRQRPFVCE